MVVLLEQPQWIKTEIITRIGHVEISLLRSRVGCLCQVPPIRRKHNASWASLDFVGIPHSGVLLWPIYRVTGKAANFEWGPEQKKVSATVRGCSASCSAPGPSDQHVQWYIRWQWQTGILFGAPGRHLQVKCSTCLTELWSKALPPSADNCPPFENSSWPSTGP